MTTETITWFSPKEKEVPFNTVLLLLDHEKNVLVGDLDDTGLFYKEGYHQISEIALWAVAPKGQKE